MFLRWGQRSCNSLKVNSLAGRFLNLGSEVNVENSKPPLNPFIVSFCVDLPEAGLGKFRG
jgi:hypothetical protein